MILPKLHSQEIVKSKGLEVEPEARSSIFPLLFADRTGMGRRWGDERGVGRSRRKDEGGAGGEEHIYTHAQGRLWHMCPPRLCTRCPLPSITSFCHLNSIHLWVLEEV